MGTDSLLNCPAARCVCVCAQGARDRGGRHERAAKRQRKAAAAHGHGAAQGQLHLQHPAAQHARTHAAAGAAQHGMHSMHPHYPHVPSGQLWGAAVQGSHTGQLYGASRAHGMAGAAGATVDTGAGRSSWGADVLFVAESGLLGPRQSSRWPDLDPEPAESSEWSLGSELSDSDSDSSAESDGVEIVERRTGGVAAAGMDAAAARHASCRGSRRVRCEDAPWQPMRMPVRQPLTMPVQGVQLRLGCGGSEGRGGGQGQQGGKLGGVGGLQMPLGWGGNEGRDQHVRKHAPRAAGQGRQPLQPADVNRGRPAAAVTRQAQATQPQWTASVASIGAKGEGLAGKWEGPGSHNSGLMYVHMHMPAPITGTQFGFASASAASRCAAHAARAPAALVAPVGAPAGQRPHGAPRLCRCGGEAAKACAFGMCGCCCQGRGCARHVKGGLAGVAGHRGGGQRGAATGSVAALKRLQAHRMR